MDRTRAGRITIDSLEWWKSGYVPSGTAVSETMKEYEPIKSGKSILGVLAKRQYNRGRGRSIYVEVCRVAAGTTMAAAEVMPGDERAGER